MESTPDFVSQGKRERAQLIKKFQKMTKEPKSKTRKREKKLKKAATRNLSNNDLFN